MRRQTKLVALVCAALALAIAGAGLPTALAAGGNPIINDCQSTGKLSHSYTLPQLRHALAIMPASVKQYTSCFDVIQNGIVTAKRTGRAGGPPPGQSSGGSFLPTPVIVILVVLILIAVTFGALAVRRRRGAGTPGRPDGPDGPDGPNDPSP
jgi:hypothetical protein